MREVWQAAHLAVGSVHSELLLLLEKHWAGAGVAQLHGTLSIYDCNLPARVVCQVRPQPAQVLSCICSEQDTSAR